MDTFLETYNLPRLDHEETKYEQITNKEIESVIKILPKNEGPEPDGLLVN